MRAVVFIVTWLILMGVYAIIRKNMKSSIAPQGNKPYKPSPYKNMSAADAEHHYEVKKLVFQILMYVATFLTVVLTITLKVMSDSSLRALLALCVFPIIAAMLVFTYLHFYYTARYAYVVLENDCDIYKADEMFRIRLESKIYPKKRNYRASAFLQRALCHLLMDKFSFETDCDHYLIEAQKLMPKLSKSTTFINIRLLKASRKGDLQDVKSCMQFIVDASRGGKIKIFDGIYEEAEIHEAYLEKNYTKMFELIDKHMKRGDCQLAYLYMYYYTAKAEFELGHYESARSYASFVYAHGPETYYAKELYMYEQNRNS